MVGNRPNRPPDSTPLSNEVEPASPPPQSSMISLLNAAAAHNVSVDKLAVALRHQQQKRLSPVYSAVVHQGSGPSEAIATTTAVAATTTTTTTTAAPPPPPPMTTAVAYAPQPVTRKTAFGFRHPDGRKVMNAPKEYYPAGYDKNFDDNFASKVDLPHTSFGCGEQKHFPGLYGDEDLGCMVSTHARAHGRRAE